MRQYRILSSLLCVFGLHQAAVQGFSPPRIRSEAISTSTKPRYATNTDASGDAAGSCPFSKSFPKYRIDLSRVDKEENSGFSLPFVGDLQKTLGKKQMEQKFKGSNIDWLEGEVSAISVFIKLWGAAAQVSESPTDRLIVGLTDASQFGAAQRWLDIFDWMQNEKSLESFLGNTFIDATIHKEGQMLAVELTLKGNPLSVDTQNVDFEPSVLDKRTQAWVKRILVDEGICPFTKSVKVSGQGLGDLGIPVAKIHYCSSDANTNQLSKLMADAWTEISYMLEMGPSGRDGISSILLAAPEYDDDFDLWSGAVFAMLESGVVACGLESQVGVVCFHPRYATPDGKSFPGFGHMHSVPRLKKWLGENNHPMQERLSDEEIAAGGAWQRRTPHATINVLRAEQLQAAEGRRVTGELYSENISKLVGKPDGIGSEQLAKDLEMERSLR